MPDDAPADGFLASTPQPPYYAVVFSSIKRRGDAERYAATAQRMVELVAQQPGFLGFESVEDVDGHGVTVSYWDSLGAIAAWRNQAEHLAAQQLGREAWYAAFRLRVCRVEAERVYEVPQSAKSHAETPPAAPAAFASLAESRKKWLDEVLRPWCRQARRADLLLADQDWINIAGRVDPEKTLWAWAWERFPGLVHPDLGLDESTCVEIRLHDGRAISGYPDARRSLQGRLELLSPRSGASGHAAAGPISIDEIAHVRPITHE